MTLNKIGAIGNANIIVSADVPGGTIMISPQEVIMMTQIIQILERLREFQSLQEKLSEPSVIVKNRIDDVFNTGGT